MTWNTVRLSNGLGDKIVSKPATYTGFFSIAFIRAAISLSQLLFSFTTSNRTLVLNPRVLPSTALSLCKILDKIHKFVNGGEIIFTFIKLFFNV